MIDTIVFILGKDTYRISKPEKFKPSAQFVLSKNESGLQARQNPTKQDLLKGIYKPRLTLFHRINTQGGREIKLKVELSLPKLLLGNNFQELRYKDFLPLIEKLVYVLKQMGVITSIEDLTKAPISAIHYAKNITLTDGSTPYHFINKIKATNIKLSLDVNQTDYRNEGHSFRWHCNSYEIVFYDKIRDLEKARISNKRALEKDSDLQLHLFDPLQRRKKFEVLRMEVRLNKRQKIKQLFKTLGIKAELTFKKLFKPAISKKVLLYYLDELERKRPILLDYKAANDKALLVTLIVNNPEFGPKQILQLFGLKKALEVVNTRELRVIFAKYNKRSWYRLMADAHKVKLPIAQRPFGIIRKNIEKFKPVRIK